MIIRSLQAMLFVPGPGSVAARIQIRTMSVCRLLKVLVPRAGVEPARPYGQRILSPMKAVPPSLTKRYKPVFTRLAVVKVSLRLA